MTHNFAGNGERTENFQIMGPKNLKGFYLVSCSRLVLSGIYGPPGTGTDPIIEKCPGSA